MISGMLFQGAFLPKDAWRSGLLFGKPVHGLARGYQTNIKGAGPLMLLGGVLAAATAPRGHALATGSRTLGYAIGALAGSAVAGNLGTLVGGYLGDKLLGAGIEKTVQGFNELAGNVRRLNMGGRYQDTEAAFTMRQVAVREMGSSLLNARRILGQEAAFMHT
jgi:hypothetical protein